MDEGLELEAPVDAGTPDAEPIETPDADGADAPEGEQPEGEQGKPEDGQAPPVAGKDLHQAVRNTLAELRKTNPQAAAALKQAYFAHGELQKEFPGGLPEVKELKQTIAQFGGADALQELKSNADYLTEIDAAFTNADPAFIEQIASASPESFVKLMPSAMDKLEAIAPDAFASMLTSRFMADVNAHGLVQDLQWLKRIAGDNKEVSALADKFLGYFQRLNGFASKPYAAPKFEQKAGQPNGEDKVAQRERDLNIREYRGEASKIAQSLFSSELAKHIAGRTVTPEKKAAIVELVTNAINRAETEDDRKKMDRYFAAGDRNGYLNLKKTILQRALPGAVERAVSVTLGAKAGPKAVAKPGSVTNGRPQAAPVAGVKTVTKIPSNSEIRWGRGGTSPDDVLRGVYTLRDGSKVQVRA